VADVCAALKLPLHVIFHGLDASALLRHATVRRRYRHLWPRAASVICVSRALADRLVATGCPEPLVHIVPCGVDETAFLPGTPEPGRVLAIGRLVEKKAPQLTIRAFAAVADRFPQAHLDLVGDGPLMPLCEAAIAEAGLSSRVTLHGPLPHAACAALLRRAAVFAQHSVTASTGDTEGSPVAIAEAMASALPVVATRHSGIPEQVEDEVTGYLVAEGDVAGMGEALARLLADPGRARAMGEAGRARCLAGFTSAESRRRLREILGLPGPPC
jgi:glycosyltransferase involved in cell wall biosynthesis